ncbi:unnamed protein product [Gongylonema pulchrum]|uniref:GTP-binding protein n=1 Tax=Gongylonema pulchrum TaxID=637853 RepID=A0A3P6SSJ3_9BILA|nr:unnamed protein product [Gongylonema pulchrum]
MKRMADYFKKAYELNNKIRFEVFIHKVDGLNEEVKLETQRDIFQRIQDDLQDDGYDKLHITQITRASREAVLITLFVGLIDQGPFLVLQISFDLNLRSFNI